MVTRPIYISTGKPENPFTKEDIKFVWVKGMSYKQKCKRRDSLHDAIAKTKLYHMDEVLEISTKSNIDLGIKLSALNLTVKFPSGKEETVENIYQSSKVFDNDHNIIEFKYGNTTFEKDPYSMYYDYIYMLGLYFHKEYHEELSKYKIFTDIEFNPERQSNTQARAAAIWNTLYKNDMTDIIESRDKFKGYYKTIFTK
jgi:type I restriction enzyme M protein